MLPLLRQVETVSDVLQTADAIGCAALRKDCLKFLVDNTEQVQKTAGFKRLVETAPNLVLDFVQLIGPKLKKCKIAGKLTIGGG